MVKKASEDLATFTIGPTSPNKEGVYYQGMRVKLPEDIVHLASMTIQQSSRVECCMSSPDWTSTRLDQVINYLLQNPSVGSKENLVWHADRVSNGLVVRQPGVGPLDLPLADFAMMLESAIYPIRLVPPHEAPANALQVISPAEASTLLQTPGRWFSSVTQSHNALLRPSGHIMACGEQASKMLCSAAIGATYGIAESITNLMLGPLHTLQDIHVSTTAHWNPTQSTCRAWLKLCWSASSFARRWGWALASLTPALPPSLLRTETSRCPFQTAKTKMTGQTDTTSTTTLI